MSMFARNRWAGVVRLYTVNDAGKKVPLEEGDVTAFLSDSNAPDAEAIDPTLVGTVTYIGDSDGCNAGDWLIVFGGDILDEELLDPVDAVYIIIDCPDIVHVYADAEYQASRLADVA